MTKESSKCIEEYSKGTAAFGITPEESGPNRLTPPTNTGLLRNPNMLRLLTLVTFLVPIPFVITLENVRCRPVVRPLAGRLKRKLSEDTVLRAGLNGRRNLDLTPRV